MTIYAVLFGIAAVMLYFVSVHYRERADTLERLIRAHRTAAAAFLLEVRKLERRNCYLERRRMWVTERAWVKRSGYRRLGAWQIRQSH